MNLTDFPNEILDDIVSKVPQNGDLASLMLVSHDFKSLAEPYFYRNVHLDAEPLEECEPGFLPTLPRTDQLTANLKARPELGRHTKAFSLRVTHPLWYQSYPQIRIIRRMPRLRQLSYDPPAFHGGGIPDQCKDLSALRLDFSHVTKDYEEDGGLFWLERGTPLEIIAENMWHPTLRQLRAEKLRFPGGFEHGHFLGQRQRRHGGSLVEDLQFLHCSPQIDGNVLTAFMNCFKRLKCFVLEIDSHAMAVSMYDESTPPVDVRPALLAHQASLEELVISTDEPTLECFDHMQYPASFVQWAALKRLAAPAFMLLGDPAHRAKLHEVLPPQLQELQITHRFWALALPMPSKFTEFRERGDFAAMKELAKHKMQSVPGLKRLIWWIQCTPLLEEGQRKAWPNSLVKGMDALEPIFKDVGVKFEFVSPRFFRETPVGQRLCEW